MNTDNIFVVIQKGHMCSHPTDEYDCNCYIYIYNPEGPTLLSVIAIIGETLNVLVPRHNSTFLILVAIVLLYHVIFHTCIIKHLHTKGK